MRSLKVFWQWVRLWLYRNCTIEYYTPEEYEAEYHEMSKRFEERYPNGSILLDDGIRGLDINMAGMKAMSPEDLAKRPRRGGY